MTSAASCVKVARMENPSKQKDATQPDLLLRQLSKARQELSILYEISNAMHKTLALDEILFIILTGVTSHTGLGFNRAMLLLWDSQANLLEGRIGIGPDNGDEAKRIWSLIDEQKMGLDDLINSYVETGVTLKNSRFSHQVRSLHVSTKEPDGGILSKVFNDGMPFHIKKENMSSLAGDPLLSIFNSDEFVIVPLKAKDKSIGLIVADNIFTRRAITNDDIRVLMMFANQAGMAIENSKLYEQMVIKTHKDALTDLWNHGYFQFMFEEELRRAKDQMSYLSLIMLDIDNFKNYNDTWGHQKGDEILVRISKIIMDSSRKVDFCCRYGGEEFAVILPDAAKKDAFVIAERIRNNIQQFPFSTGNEHPPQSITVSIGLASFPEDGKTKAEMIRAADAALYNAKREGKNRVASFIPTEHRKA